MAAREKANTGPQEMEELPWGGARGSPPLPGELGYTRLGRVVLTTTLHDNKATVEATSCRHSDG